MDTLPITTGQVLTFLFIVVGMLLIVILYHLMFIVVDLRKVTRRFSDLSEEVEALLLKPISVADQTMQWVIDFIENRKQKKRHNVMDHHHRTEE